MFPFGQKQEGEAKAEQAFASPTALAAARVGARSPPGTIASHCKASLSPSRRSIPRPKLDQDPEILGQIADVTSIRLVKSRSSPTPETPVNRASYAMSRADAAISSAMERSVGRSGAGSTNGSLGSGNAASKSVKTPVNVAPPTTSVVASNESLGSGPGNSGKSAPPQLSAVAPPPILVNKVPLTPQSSITSVGSKTKDLDLKHNDNSFHVVANLIVDRFLAKLSPGATTLVVTESDQRHLEQMVPPSIRANLVEAVRFRLANLPPDSEAPIHVLTRQCQELGLHRDGDNNLLLASLAPNKRTITITDLPPALGKSRSAAPRSRAVSVPRGAVSSSPVGKASALDVSPAKSLKANAIFIPDLATSNGSLGRPSLSIEEENEILRAKLQEQQEQLRRQKALMEHLNLPPTTVSPIPRGAEETSLEGSTVTGPFVGGGGASLEATPKEHHQQIIAPGANLTAESLARQQLMAELREASNLMAESVTPEAAKFWRDHVVELQARLRALHGETGSVVSYPQGNDNSEGSVVTPQEILESNQRFLAQLEAHPVVLPTPEVARKPEVVKPSFQQQQKSIPVASPSVPPPPPLAEISGSKYSRGAPAFMADYDLRGVPVVDVVAPADLQGGYHFEAEVEGRRFLATVPAGGVRKGETFSCHMRDLEQVGSDIPVGRWRDRLTDCFTNGTFHPAVVSGLFCPLLSLGQIMTRMKFDYLGRPVAPTSGLTAFKMMQVIFLFWILINLAVVSAFHVKWRHGMELSNFDVAAIILVNVGMLVYAIFSTSSTRSSLREKYMIREHRFYDLEDCFCATFCMPCTICQMNRHTASFVDYDAVWCSDTGLPDGVDIDRQPRQRWSSSKVVDKYLV